MSRHSPIQVAIRLRQFRRCSFRPGVVATVGSAMQDRIGRDLRGMYDALLREPVPDSILALVAHLSRSPRRTLP